MAQYDPLKTLVIIPARGGSKGLPNKNIKILGDKPLIAHTVFAAREVFADAQICVSTDSPQIASVVRDLGLEVPFIRPAELATDNATTRSVILHAIEFYSRERNFDVEQIVLLQPTSPFRRGLHIKEALALASPDLDMVVSVKASSSNPYFNLFEEDGDGFLHKSKPFAATRRQDVPVVWEFNGAIYIFEPETIRKMEFSSFRKIRKYEMDEFSSMDIDTEFDWVVAEYIVHHK